MVQDQIQAWAASAVGVVRALDVLRREGHHARTHEFLGRLARGDVQLPVLPFVNEIGLYTDVL